MNRYAPALCACACLLFGGCAGPASQNDASSVTYMLRLYGKLSSLSVEEQYREYQAALAHFEKQPGDSQRLHLALALSLPRAPWRDDARVLQLVEGIAESPSAEVSPHKDLAWLLQNLTIERLRLLREEQSRAEVAQSRTDQSQARLQHVLAERQRQLIDEQRRVKELERKLDALLEIDRTTRHRSVKR